MSATPVPARRTLWLVVAYGIWALAFALLYGVQALGCAYGWNVGEAAFGLSVHRILLIALFGLSVVAVGVVVVLNGALAARQRDAIDPDPFLTRVGYILSLTALGATVLSFFPVFFAAVCH